MRTLPSSATTRIDTVGRGRRVGQRVRDEVADRLTDPGLVAAARRRPAVLRTTRRARAPSLGRRPPRRPRSRRRRRGAARWPGPRRGGRAAGARRRAVPCATDSSSIRRIATARSSGRWSAPRRNNSAYPRIDVSGVRSSCDASDTNRRNRSSERCRSANASSRRSSIVLIDPPSRPTSVRSVASGTRRPISPDAIAAAVCSIRPSGRSPMPASHHANTLSTTRTAAATVSSATTSRRSVSCTGSSGSATTSVPPRGSDSARTRYSATVRRVGGEALAAAGRAGPGQLRRQLGDRSLVATQRVRRTDPGRAVAVADLGVRTGRQGTTGDPPGAGVDAGGVVLRRQRGAGRQAGVVELLVDPIEQERALQEERRRAGDDEPDERDEQDAGDESRPERHVSRPRSRNAAAAGCSRRLGPCGSAADPADRACVGGS